MISSLELHGGNPHGDVQLLVSFGHSSGIPPGCRMARCLMRLVCLLVLLSEPMRPPLAKGSESPETVLKNLFSFVIT